VKLFVVMFNGDIIREVSGPPVSINQSYHFLQKSAHPFKDNYTVDLVGLSIPTGLNSCTLKIWI